MTRKKKENKLLDDSNFNSFEPKTKNKFIVNFDEYNIPSHVIYSVSPLLFSTGVVKYEMNGKDSRRQDGNLKWDDISLKMYDIISSSPVPELYRMISDMIKSNNPYVSFVINEIDNVGEIISETKVSGVLSTIDFGKFDWNDSEVKIIEIKVMPEDVILTY